MKKIFVKKIIIACLSIPLILNSCSTVTSSTEEKIELVEIQYPKEISNQIDDFLTEKFDFIINSDFFDDSIKNNSKTTLDVEIIKLFSSKLSKDSFTETNTYYLNDYYKIEEAKKEKKYEEYIQKLDIGMMRDANCYALSRLEFGDSIGLLIWKIDYSSYEACPYYAGTHVMGTLIVDGKIKETLQLANKETAADAPMSSLSNQSVKITATGKILCNYETTVDEEETRIEHSKEKLEFQISKTGFKLISTKK